MCVAGNTTQGVVFCYLNAANDVIATTMNPSTLATTVGPTAVISSATLVGTPAVAVLQTSQIFLVQIQSGGGVGPNSTYASYVTATHGPFALEATYPNVRLTSKIYEQACTGSLFEMGVALGSLTIGGNTAGTDQVYATHLQVVDLEGFHCAGRWNYGVADQMIDSVATNYHGRSSVAFDGLGNFWAACGTLDEGTIGTTAPGTLQVVRFKSAVANRRQWVESQGALYIAGGFVGYYDGSTLSESGFLDTPVISGNTQGTAGSLTQLATYNYIAVYEWYDAKGRLHRSTPSAPFEVVMTGANDDNAVVVSSPRSMRRIDAVGGGSSVLTVLYRTTPNDSVFYRVGQAAAGTVASTYCSNNTITDTMSDATAQTRPILYIYVQKPTPNVAPLPCRFIAAGRDRLMFGGLPDPYMIAFSQLAFPNEPLESASSNNFAYVARLPEPCTAVAAPGDSYIAFTEQGIYEIPGAGPQRNGTGEFFTPRTLYSDGGCIDWRSVVDTAMGVFFQLASDKLYLLTPPGPSGTQLVWVGKPAQDTLTTYPVVRAAALCTATQRVVFAVVNSDTAAESGGLLIYDIQKNAWSFDDVGVVKALVEYQSRVAYLHNDGSVYLEQAAVGSGGSALPSVSVRTGSFRLFQGMGYGDILKIGLLGTYLGDCTVEGFISYDDGKTWTATMGTQAVTAANMANPQTGAALAVGDPVSVIFTPNRRSVDRFALRFDVTHGSNTGGMRMHMVSLECEGQEFTTRQPARNQR
jgi:hypothetical protein